MKRLMVTARFPRALVKHSMQRADVSASTIPAGISRALREILRRPGVKGKRHRAFYLLVAVVPNGGGKAQPKEEGK